MVQFHPEAFMNEINSNVKVFTVQNFEMEQYEKWIKKHKKKCLRRKIQTAIGGSETWNFTPTSIGTFIQVECCCGEKFNIDSNM